MSSTPDLTGTAPSYIPEMTGTAVPPLGSVPLPGFGIFPSLLEEERDLLARAKEANPWYFASLLEAAAIMPGRRKNYSPNADPFENFKIAADILRHYRKFRDIDLDAEDVAFVYAVLKLARILTGGDTSYEATADGARDAVNYFLLMRGIAIQGAGEAKKEPGTLRLTGDFPMP